MVALSVAVIAAVLDATRSIAAEQLVKTPLEATWASLMPASLEAFETSVKSALSDFAWTGIVEPVLQVPTFAFFAGLALLLYVAGRRPTRNVGRFVMEN